MARLVAGQGFALDMGESRLTNGFVADAFTTLPDAAFMVAGTGSEAAASVRCTGRDTAGSPAPPNRKAQCSAGQRNIERPSA